MTADRQEENWRLLYADSELVAFSREDWRMHDGCHWFEEEARCNQRSIKETICVLAVLCFDGSIL